MTTKDNKDDFLPDSAQARQHRTGLSGKGKAKGTGCNEDNMVAYMFSDSEVRLVAVRR